MLRDSGINIHFCHSYRNFPHKDVGIQPIQAEKFMCLVVDKRDTSYAAGNISGPMFLVLLTSPKPGLSALQV